MPNNIENSKTYYKVKKLLEENDFEDVLNCISYYYNWPLPHEGEIFKEFYTSLSRAKRKYAKWKKKK